MTKFFFKFKKSYFWPFLVNFPNFGGKKLISQNRVFMHNFKGFLASCQNLEKSNDPVPRRHPDRCQGARMDRPYFIESF